MMTKEECQALEEMPVVGYWSELGGVEVKKIEYGVEDYILCVSNAWYHPHGYHRLRIKYSTRSSREYVIVNRTRLYLDECLRTNL